MRQISDFFVPQILFNQKIARMEEYVDFHKKKIVISPERIKKRDESCSPAQPSTRDELTSRDSSDKQSCQQLRLFLYAHDCSGQHWSTNLLLTSRTVESCSQWGQEAPVPENIYL